MGCAQAAIEFIVKRWPVISSAPRIPTQARQPHNLAGGRRGRAQHTIRACPPSARSNQESCRAQTGAPQIYERELVAENGHKSIGLVTNREWRSKPAASNKHSPNHFQRTGSTFTVVVPELSMIWPS